MLKTVLVPVDDDPCSEHCVQYAFDLARLLGSQVVILHVATCADGLDRGKTILERLGHGGRFPARMLLIQHPSVPEAVLKVIEKHKADLLLLGRCAGDAFTVREGIREKLLEQSPIPVQVVPIQMKTRPSYLDRFQTGV
ncbi:universal stress protein [Deinococcus cellulosilyticus]|uniref:UspA domain-containing protein n=1 Tax=Deinococcus cellulosilyticus (strain DSM 18568 / NBRC 106333 / KACC 11606 / 5516J-15) TaxID=1223518 RepID=A0A511MZE7_DEIC1|nr:universal stress protein [Deinococcus cellulosilyticus]GEM45537.1 hypothetical protein DC3_11720 [Deinococcus cellulosilyticus NBRC 106333 = KACC 11606]